MRYLWPRLFFQVVALIICFKVNASLIWFSLTVILFVIVVSFIDTAYFVATITMLA